MSKSTVKKPWLSFYTNGEEEKLEYPTGSLYDALAVQCLHTPEKLAVEYYNTKISYKELLLNIHICAKAFVAIGVKKGDIITLCLPNIPEAIYAFYAVNALGAVASMVHPLSGENEIAKFIKESDSKVVVTIPAVCEKIANILPKVELLSVIAISPKESMDRTLSWAYSLKRADKNFKKIPKSIALSYRTFLNKGRHEPLSLPQNKGEDMAAILYSGGTSGSPKGICLSNLNFNALAKQSIAAIATLDSSERVLSIMPIFHGFGLGVGIHTILLLGATVIIRPTFSVKTFHKLLLQYSPTVLVGVPTLYEALLRSEKMKQVDLSQLNAVVSGGDSLSVSLKKKVDEFLAQHGANVTVREGYGLTECVTGSCLTPLNHYKPGSIGIPYPGMAYKIIEPNTQKNLPFGQEGEIAISGATLMQGYWQEEDATAKAIQAHADGLTWLHTGDLGSMDEEGFVYFKQRIQRMIVSSGYNVYPQYIEEVIDSHPKVLMSAVVGVPHAYKQQVAKAYVVLKNGVSPSESLQQEIQDLCVKNLAIYSLPADIIFKEELPKTLVGKVAYQELVKEASKENGL